MRMRGDKSASAESQCTVCGSTDISVFLEILRLPVHCNVLCSTYEKALRARRGDIRLAFCRKCCHIFNLAFKPEAMKYGHDYENSLHFSPLFQKYATNLARRLVTRYDLHNKNVIEIGCGRGDFLTLVCKLGGNHGIGFDPSYNRKRTDDATLKQIIFIQDFYSPAYAGCKADFICCRHVLEHIRFPREFLTNIYDVISDETETNVFFEVPNAKFTLRDLGIWDLIYEHCSYFCARSLKHLFITCGFEVCGCTEAFEGQFLNIEAAPAKDLTNPAAEPGYDFERMDDYVRTFQDRYNSTVNRWQHKIEKMRRSAKRAVVWGAGSKGVSFLNVLGIKGQIEYVVDINPYKQGKYIAGTGQKIVLPGFLKECRPDIVIIMNSIYRYEIQQVVQELGLTAEFVFA